jgi:hypothetical protein
LHEQDEPAKATVAHEGEELVPSLGGEHTNAICPFGRRPAERYLPFGRRDGLDEWLDQDAARFVEPICESTAPSVERLERVDLEEDSRGRELISASGVGDDP